MTRTVSDSNSSISRRVMQTTALSDRVARVLLMRSWIRESMLVLPWSIGTGLICVLVVRWFGGWGSDSLLDRYWFGFPIAAVLVSAGLGFVRAWTTRPTRTSAAGWFDESAHTQSRFRSALELAAVAGVDSAFADIAVDAAERDARGAIKSIPNQDSELGWQQRPAFSIALVFLVLTIIAGIWMPQRSSPEPQQLVRSVQSIDEAQEHIQAKQEQLLETADLASEDDELVQQALDDLSEIEQELVSSDSSSEPDSATALADSRIQRLADELEQRSEQQNQEEQALREKLDKLRSDSLSDSSDLERFREQLAEGQYEDAIEELEALNESMDSMTPEQREQAAQDLESLANAIEKDSPSTSLDREELATDTETERPASKQPDPAKKLSDSMREEAEKIRESATERESSTDEQTPPQNQESEKPSSEPTQESDSETEQGSNPESEQSQESRDENTADESKQGDQHSSETQQGREGSEQQSDPAKQNESGQEPSDSQSSSSEPKSDESTDQQNPTNESSQEPSQEEDQQSEQQGDQQGEKQTPQEQQGSEPKEESGDESGEQPSQEPGKSAQDQGEQGQEEGQEQGEKQAGEQATEKKATQDSPGKESDLKEMLRQAQRRSEGAQRDREMSERLREQLDQSEDRQDGSQKNEQQDRNNNSEQSSGSQGSQENKNEPQNDPQPGSQGDPAQQSKNGSTAGQDDPREMNPETGDDQSEYVPVQAADENSTADEDSTPLGRWYNPDQEGERSATGKSDTAKRFRDASKKAREEVSDRRVPRKYRDVISEYFKKLDERAGKLAPSSASSDGQDAPSPKQPSSSGGSD